MKTKLFNLFPEWFKKLPHSDKIAHAIIGLLIFVPLVFVFSYLPLWRDRTSFALVAVSLIAYFTEVYDQKKGGTGRFWDIGATILIPMFLTLAAHIAENGQ